MFIVMKGDGFRGNHRLLRIRVSFPSLGENAEAGKMISRSWGGTNMNMMMIIPVCSVLALVFAVYLAGSVRK